MKYSAQNLFERWVSAYQGIPGAIPCVAWDSLPTPEREGWERFARSFSDPDALAALERIIKVGQARADEAMDASMLRLKQALGVSYAEMEDEKVRGLWQFPYRELFMLRHELISYVFERIDLARRQERKLANEEMRLRLMDVIVSGYSVHSLLKTLEEEAAGAAGQRPSR